MTGKFKNLINSIINWLFRIKLWILIWSIMISVGLLIILGASALPTIMWMIIAILINFLTSYKKSRQYHYSKLFRKYTKIHMENLRENVLKPQEFYINRQPIENDLKNWIEENETGFAIVTGVAGSGKTNLLCKLASHYISKNYNVLFIESDLLENFKKEKMGDKSFAEVLTSVKNKERKKTIIFLDTLDLIAYNSGLRKLITFLSDIKQCEEGIIVGTIRQTEYEKLKDKIVKTDKIFFLNPLQNFEIEELFKKYNKNFELSQENIHLLSIPLYVHMFMEVYENEGIPDITNFVQLYENYWQKKVESLREGALPDYNQKDKDIIKGSKEKLVYLLASKMFQNRTHRYNKTDFKRNIRDSDNGLLAYNDLMSEHIFIEYSNYIKFFHQTFFEYTIAKYLLEEQKEEQLNKLIDETNLDIPFYRGIFEYLAILSKNREKIIIYKAIIDKLSNSTSHFQHILFINILSNLHEVEAYEIKIIEDLIHKNADLFDYILGLIISDLWRPDYVDFALLDRLIDHGEYEIKRRITKALPQLILLNNELSLKLMSRLRTDYDIQWKTDIRRRVIEATSILISNGYLDIEDLLRINDDDEFYVIIAIVEIIDCVKCVNSKKAEKLIDSLENKIDDQQRIFVSWLLDLLEKIRLKKYDAIGMIMSVVHSRTSILILPSGDDAYRICISRNVHRLLEDFPDEILEIMKCLLNSDEHKNVRRPLVRQVRKLIEFMVKKKDYTDTVEEIIWNLATDKDEIIPITFSDNLLFTTRIAPTISMKIVNYYLDKEGMQTLRYFSDDGKNIILRRIEEIKKYLDGKI